MLKGSIWVPYTDVTTSLEELGGIKSYRRSKHTTCLEGGKSAKSGPGSQIGAVCRCEGEEKAHHSHTTQSKAPFGSHIRCYNKFRRIGEHQNIQEE